MGIRFKRGRLRLHQGNVSGKKGNDSIKEIERGRFGKKAVGKREIELEKLREIG